MIGAGGQFLVFGLFFFPNIMTVCYLSEKKNQQYGRPSQFHLTREQKTKDRRDQENQIFAD